MKKTLVVFAAGIVTGVIFNDRIRAELSKVKKAIDQSLSKKVNEKTAEVLHEKIDVVFGVKKDDEKKEEPKESTNSSSDAIKYDISMYRFILAELLEWYYRNGNVPVTVADLRESAGDKSHNYTDILYGWNSLKELLENIKVGNHHVVFCGIHKL